MKYQKLLRRLLVSALLLAVSTSATHFSPTMSAPSGNQISVTVTDIGPELGASYSAAGFVIKGDDPRQIILSSEGGIFKSLNGGQSWSPVQLVNDSGFLEGSFFIRQDPNNASVLFIVTLGSPGMVYRSNDFGKTWARVDADLVEPVDCAIDQASSNVVFVLSRIASDDPEQPTALFKSVDGGITFAPQLGSGLPEKLFDSEGEPVPADPHFTNIATTPADPNIVYVAHFGDPDGYYAPGIYKSIDGGESFTRLEEGPPLPIQVFPHPTNPNVVFVQDQSDLESPGIYRSDDGGATFSPVTGGLPTGKWNFFVAFDQHNPLFVYIAGEGGFFRSTDGGTSFHPLELKPDQIGLGATTATVDPANPSVIYVNTNRGNFKSVNAGVSFAAINNGWKAAFGNHITFDNTSDPGLYLAVPFGNGILKTRSRGNHYEQIPHPIDPGDLHSGERWPRFLDVLSTDPNFIVALTRSSGIHRTVDGGQLWQPASTDTGQSRFSRVAIDPVNPNYVYVTSAFSGSPGFYRSSDGGQNFERTYFVPSSTSRSFFFDLEIDSSNPNVIYTGSVRFLTNNVLLKSIDGGLTFTGAQLGFASSITDIEVDPSNPNNVYVAGRFRLSNQTFVENILVRSTDGGVTFIPADSGITESEIIGIVIDPQIPSRLFAWTTEGLFMSTDSAMTWTLLEGEKTRQAAGFGSAIAINPKKPDRLYLAGATILEVEIKSSF